MLVRTRVRVLSDEQLRSGEKSGLRGILTQNNKVLERGQDKGKECEVSNVTNCGKANIWGN